MASPWWSRRAGLVSLGFVERSPGGARRQGGRQGPVTFREAGQERSSARRCGVPVAVRGSVGEKGVPLRACWSALARRAP